MGNWEGFFATVQGRSLCFSLSWWIEVISYCIVANHELDSDASVGPALAAQLCHLGSSLRSDKSLATFSLVSLCSQKQVAGIYAILHIALMQYVKALRNWPYMS
jgi:hypothetical protein